jgi:hypothetical protein
MPTPSFKKLLYVAIVALVTVVGLRSGFSQEASVKVFKSGDVLSAEDLNSSFAAQAALAAPGGIPYVWTNYHPNVQNEGLIQPDGHVARLTFTSPVEGLVWASASYEIHVRNTFDTQPVHCRVESLMGLTPGMSTCAVGTFCSLTGYAENTINSNLPTQGTEGGAVFGVTQVVSRVIPIVKGENVIYLSGRTDCASASWGTLTMTAMLIKQAPSATVSMP